MTQLVSQRESGDLMTEKLATITIEAKAADIPFATSGLEAPAIYAEDIRGAMRSEGTTKLNLVEYRMSAQDEKMVAVHVATLILPSERVAGWGAFLSKLAGAEAAADPDSPAEPSAEA